MRTTCLCFLLLAAALPARAQEALVLSGGGSRGLAHVGVFQALQERGYDPDMVIGTSMGAVVGALYAAGYEPEEIRRRVIETGWAELFSATPVVIGPERAVRYPMLNLDLDISRLRFSRGLLGQWRINRALVRLLFEANARSRGDFDRLARRYRAVAADLRTGDAVVLDSGDLARAARASMAVPGFFAPVGWEGRVLVDGGIADNLPTNLARRLGAVRVLASDVSRPEPEITSQAPFAIIGRALDLMQENTQRDTVAPDALVLPKLDPGLTGATFPADPAPLIDSGRTAGLRDLPAAPVVVGRGARPLPPEPAAFSALVVEAADRALAELAKQAFAGVAPGKYDAAAVLRAVDVLYSTGLFEGIWPRVEAAVGTAPDTVDAPVLHVRLEGQPRLSLAAGAGYDNDLGGRAWGSLDRYTTLLGRAAVISASATFAGLDRRGALSARVHPQGRLGIAWSGGVHLQERDVRFFLPDALGVKETLRAGGWLGIELPHILRDQFTTAIVRGEWIDPEAGGGGTAIGPLLRFSALPADEPVVGVPLLLEGERRWGTYTYTRFAASASRTFLLGPVQLAPLVDARAVSRAAPADVRPALGDQHAVPGLRWGEGTGRARVVGGVDVAYGVAGGSARLRLRSGTSVEQLDAWERSRWITGAQLGVHWQSPLGVVEFGYGRATRGDGRFDLDVGRRF